MLIWLTMILSRRSMVDRRPPPTSLRLSLPGDLWRNVLGLVSAERSVTSTSMQHFRPSETQTNRDGWFSRQSYLLGHFRRLQDVQDMVNG